MPVRRKLVGTKPTAKRSASKVEVELPTELSLPSHRLSDYSMLLFGEKKIGKTSLASKFPKAMFLMLEPGGKALRIYQAAIHDWETFVAHIDALEKDTNAVKSFDTVVVDTVDLAYDYCFEYMCEKLGVEHPSDERDYGKTWGKIENEFVAQFTRLLRLDKGVILISHEQLREVVNRDGSTFDRIGPSVAKQASRFLEGVVDIWAYYGYWGHDRHLLIKGNELIGAGCRLEENFQTPEKKPVIAIPGGKSSTEAYANFLKAFNNKQPTDGGEIFKKKDTAAPSRKSSR